MACNLPLWVFVLNIYFKKLTIFNCQNTVRCPKVYRESQIWTCIFRVCMVFLLRKNHCNLFFPVYVLSLHAGFSFFTPFFHLQGPIVLLTQVEASPGNPESERWPQKGVQVGLTQNTCLHPQTLPVPRRTLSCTVLILGGRMGLKMVRV